MIHLLFLLPLFFVSSSAFDDDHIAPMIPFDRLDDVAEMMFAYSEKLEMIDAVVDGICAEYSGFCPDDEEKLNLLKRDVSHLDLASNMEKKLALHYKRVPSSIRKLLDIASQQHPRNEEELELKDYSEYKYMLAKMSLHHLVKHLDAKKKLYDEAGFTEEEIKKDIGTRALVLLDKIHKGDPFVKLEETKDQRMLLLLLFLAPCLPAWQYDLERGAELKKWVYLYTTTYEMTDRMVDDLCEEYWELCPFDESEIIVLKREIMHFNDDKEYSISELWVGFPSKYKMIPIALKKVQELGKKLYALLPESYKKKYEDEDDFIFRWLCFDRMMKHVKENKKFFEIHKMTDEQIQKALFDHEMDLIDKFHKDDPDIEKTPEKIKAALALARAKQEL